MISQEDPIEYSRQKDTVEHNNRHPLKHRYPTRIAQMSQDINQVEVAAAAATRHQHWLMNIHEQVNTTPQVIDNCLKENACKPPKTMTHHDYPKNMANLIIDDDTVKEFSYLRCIKHTKHQKIWKRSFANNL